MTELLTEEEQVEQLKKWWQENGMAIFVGLAIGIGIIVGVYYWRSYKAEQANSASNQYHEFSRAVALKDATAEKTSLDNLRTDFSGTSYAALASIYQAKLDIDKGNIEAAIQKLEWAVQNPGHDSIAHLARIRLVRILLSQNKLDDSNKWLDEIHEAAFDHSYQELRGDIYARQGEQEKARQAYQLALASNNLAGKQREFVEMKLQDLPVAESQQKETTTKE